MCWLAQPRGAAGGAKGFITMPGKNKMSTLEQESAETRLLLLQEKRAVQSTYGGADAPVGLGVSAER